MEMYNTLMTAATYPTPEHARAARAVTEFFARSPLVQAVLLTNSVARGRATPDSCLDLAILLDPSTPEAGRTALHTEWEAFHANDPACRALKAAGRYAHVDLEFTTGVFVPGYHDWTSGPDGFELEIGNYLVYSQPLYMHGDRLEQLKRAWLPYYDETLRRARLAEVRRFCRNNLEHIPLYVARGLYFQSLGRLWNAFQEFLQALFISCGVYPIAYDKWIHEQVVEILDLPELYPQLTSLFEVERFESPALTHKAALLLELLETYTAGEPE